MYHSNINYEDGCLDHDHRIHDFPNAQQIWQHTTRHSITLHTSLRWTAILKLFQWIINYSLIILLPPRYTQYPTLNFFFVWTENSLRSKESWLICQLSWLIIHFMCSLGFCSIKILITNLVQIKVKLSYIYAYIRQLFPKFYLNPEISSQLIIDF